MDIKEIKARYGEAILEAMTTRDGSGRGWVCPICGSGSGHKGTGLAAVPKKRGYYKCFNVSCEFYGDVLELIGKTYNLPDTAQQIEKAGQLIGRDFTEDFNNHWFDDKPDKGKPAARDVFPAEENKNQLQDTDFKDFEKTPEAAAFRKYIETAAANLHKGGRAYLLSRGIPAELAEKYKIGFVEYYGDGMNSPAVIIPTGEYSYTARATTTNDKARKVRKKTAAENIPAGVFGIDIMNDPPPFAFVVEGELDALSVMAAGFPAIATGGGTSKREIVADLKRQGIPQTLFLVLPDNDRKRDGSPDTEKGVKAGKDLVKALNDAGIRAALVDVLGGSWPQKVKDSNEFLIKDRSGFSTFLQETKKAVEEKLLGRAASYMQEFIKQIAGNTPPIPTRYFVLDTILEGGFHPGLIILGAISSLGKTTFCLNIADTLAEAGQDVLFYSLEMSKFELISKIISRRTAQYCLDNKLSMALAKTNLGVSDFKRWANYSQAEKELLQNTMTAFEKGAGQYLCIKEGLQDIGTEQIRRDIQNYIFITGRRPVVIVDYVQILKTPDVHMTDKQRTDANVVELKRISRDYNLPVIGISSFNRDNYLQPVNMAAFKESGALEYTSDVLIGLQYCGMDYMDGDSEKKRADRIRALFKENEQAARAGRAIYIQCKVLKNRSGGKNDCVFNYFPMFNLYAEEPAGDDIF